MLKESSYVKLANTMYRVLRNSRIPMFFHRKSNHVFTVWQHLVVLLTIRQYEGKSYRMFVDWLVEAYYLRIVLLVCTNSVFKLCGLQTMNCCGLQSSTVHLIFVVTFKIAYE